MLISAVRARTSPARARITVISCASSASITWEPTASRRRLAFSSHLFSSLNFLFARQPGVSANHFRQADLSLPIWPTYSKPVSGTTFWILDNPMRMISSFIIHEASECPLLNTERSIYLEQRAESELARKQPECPNGLWLLP